VDGDFYGVEYCDVADVDLDGDLDVIGAAYYGDGPELGRNGRYAWIENLEGDASAWEQHWVANLFWGAIYIDAGDLDGDGDIDLVGASELTDGIWEQEADMAWFENLDGAGEVWGQHDIDLFFENASEAHMVDLDGDGDLDIVGTYSDSYSTSRFAWWENADGDASRLVKNWIPGEYWGSGYCDVGDIDGDGDVDLLGGGYNTSSVGFWENLDGTGHSWTAWTVTTMPSGRGVELTDLDGDGDLDALAWNTYWMSWLENLDGVGYHWDIRLLGYDYNDPWGASGDIDNDGKIDIVVTSEETDWPPPGDDQLVSYDIGEFLDAGRLTGSVIDGGADPGWGIMTWNGVVPLATALELKVRASDNEGDLGPWISVPASGTDLGLLIDPGARYLQYRVGMTSGDPEVAPVLRDVHIEMGEGSGLAAP